MATTLIDAAKKYEGDPLRSAVIQTFAQSSDILRVLPFENVSGAGIDFTREETLPGIGFRGVNDAFAEDAGNLEKLKESLKIMGGDLDVDKFIVDTMGSDQRSLRTFMKAKAAALKFTQSFIKGDVTSDVASFNGLQKRLGDAASDQVIHAGATSGGDALSLAKLTDAIDAVDEPTHIIMSKKMRNLLTVAARTTTVGGNIEYSVDEFGKRVTMFDGLPIIIADKDNENNLILPFTEANPGGGTAASTSIYVVAMGAGMLSGIQSADMMVRDLGELETKPVYRTRAEWYVNFVLWHPRGASRVSGIKNAAVVA